MAHPASSKVAGLALSAIAWIVHKKRAVSCCVATLHLHVAWQLCLTDSVSAFDTFFLLQFRFQLSCETSMACEILSSSRQQSLQTTSLLL